MSAARSSLCCSPRQLHQRVDIFKGLKNDPILEVNILWWHVVNKANSAIFKAGSDTLPDKADMASSVVEEKVVFLNLPSAMPDESHPPGPQHHQQLPFWPPSQAFLQQQIFNERQGQETQQSGGQLGAGQLAPAMQAPQLFQVVSADRVTTAVKAIN